MTFFSRSLPLFLALSASLAACSTPEPPRQKPSIYESMARPGAKVDQAKAVEMISQYRIANGAGPLKTDPKLVKIAQDYAEAMAKSGDMTHVLQPYGSLLKRLRDAGYAYKIAGENIAAGQYTLADVFSEWRQSPRHDAGMKSADKTVMGIGVAYNPNSKYKVYWCLILAWPKTPEEVAAAAATQ
ncbi:Cysteine-rich secretory protein family protein [Hartmannibacter diazotrophicus]|uniref:Cysteine-rich secretory protein family protein n=1 Tax=Hartmannibacter diazotrophicus TaxID=1482074 RepID=A0A2C9DAZ1_9HYPH|nr:CAP domain-containing protein [Hartmannibacter diazotrophicus]SON57492.1 Cysteine-rich secretory protein family protein [Hartmannibacter diazotrophicus]